MSKPYRPPVCSALACLPRVFWLLALFASCAIGLAQASSDYSEPEPYSLLHSTAPFLAPANDNRVTLMLLLSDAGLAQPRLPTKWWGDAPVSAYFGETPLWFGTIAAVFGEEPEIEVASGICPQRIAANRGYQEALKASAVPASEQALLIEARNAMDSQCGSAAKDEIKSVLDRIGSPAGKEFAAYLKAAIAFHLPDFDSSNSTNARNGFATLMTSKQPWVEETATYMVARMDLMQAQQGTFGEYGELRLENVSPDSLGIAETGLRTYLKKYPKGKYAASARGLLRRVAWFGRDYAALEKEFAHAFALADPSMLNVSVPQLAYEAANKLLGNGERREIREPRLLAALDLMLMRSGQAEPDNPARLTREALQAQEATFAHQKELFNYLLAAYAFYVEGNPAAALKQIGDAAPGPKMNFVQFSQQALKGLALEATQEAMQARAHWLALVPLAEPVLQRPAVELALAQNYEKSGEIDKVFAPDSPIRNPTYREILLVNSSGPELLRQRAKAADAATRERQLALYILLFKELTRGHYQDFLNDLPLIPATGPLTSMTSMTGKLGVGGSPALDDFNWPGGTNGNFVCPSLRDTVAALASNPHDERKQVCLGEFLRLKDYDGFLSETERSQDHRIPTELGRVAAQFPGKGKSRLDIYKQVIANPKADKDVRAYALFRTVNCWAPSGHNACDNADVPISQRKQWFQELKTKYRNTVWAGELKYYW